MPKIPKEKHLKKISKLLLHYQKKRQEADNVVRKIMSNCQLSFPQATFPWFPKYDDDVKAGESEPPRHRVGEKFLKNPIPLDWLSFAAKLPGKSLAVGLTAWFLAGVTKRANVRLSSSLLRSFGVSRKAGYRAVAKLENAGLVSVERRRGKCAEVKLLRAKPET